MMPTSKITGARLARLFSSSSSKERLVRRCRLLDSCRGLIDHCDSSGTNRSLNERAQQSQKRPLPSFPLESRHFRGLDELRPAKGGLPPNTPKEFHQRLCEMIRNAKERVRIASLYVGPATSSRDDCEETELLQALSELVDRNRSIGNGDKEVSIKIVLDENRALRPVPLATKDPRGDETPENSKATTSSAEAVARALQRGSSDESGSSSSSLHLFRVLPPTKIGEKNWLPNPLDEIAGVFHIKIYIVDDQLLLSGANLSREYFRDRMDRYLHLVEGANGMVDFYADLVDILCRHSSKYNVADLGNNGVEKEVLQQPAQRNDFLKDITNHFQDPKDASSSVQSAQELFAVGKENEKIVAVGVPTFQAPAGYFRHTNHNEVTKSPRRVAGDLTRSWSTFWSLWFINRQPADKVEFFTDVEATLNLLKEAGDSNKNNSEKANDYGRFSAQLSSAYLNPTKTLLAVLQGGFKSVELLSAGKISHGFKPKKKECQEGSRGKDWTIPSIFDKLVDECMSFLRSTGVDARLYFWERPGWTFHAKGIWLREEDIPSSDKSGAAADEVAAVVVGSSNYGYRSFYRDMESNLVLVFPPGSSSLSADDDENIVDVASSFGEEWKNLVASSKLEVVEEETSSGEKEKDTAEKPPPLPWPIRKSIPHIKTYF